MMQDNYNTIEMFWIFGGWIMRGERLESTASVKGDEGPGDVSDNKRIPLGHILQSDIKNEMIEILLKYYRNIIEILLKYYWNWRWPWLVFVQSDQIWWKCDWTNWKNNSNEKWMRNGPLSLIYNHQRIESIATDASMNLHAESWQPTVLARTPVPIG